MVYDDKVDNARALAEVPVVTTPPRNPAGVSSGAQTAAFRRIVRNHMDTAPPTVEVGATCADVVDLMRKKHSTSVLVHAPGGRLRGIVTEQDVVRRIAFQVDGPTPVERIMSTGVVTIAEDDLLFQAIATMSRSGLRHMPVVNAEGKVTGILHLDVAIAAAVSRLMRLIEQLTHEDTQDGLRQVKEAQVEVAEALIDDRVPAVEVQGLLSHINMDIYRRVLKLVMGQLAETGWGQPPLSFCAIVMGSGGRGESFLYPDQDNGFIIEDYPDDRHGVYDAYFTELGDRMSYALDAVGVPLCRGYVMANNPLWRKTLSQWRNQVTYWLIRASESTIRLGDIFFDFSPVYGKVSLAQDLRQHVATSARGQFHFLRAMQRVQADHGVALGLFGRLTPERGSGPHRGKVNLKYHGLLPLVEAVRLLALREGVAETGTLARMAELSNTGIFNRDEQEYLAQAFHHITLLILRQQLTDFRAGREVNAFVDPDTLTERERALLVDSLQSIADLRNRMRTEFTGEIF